MIPKDKNCIQGLFLKRKRKIRDFIYQAEQDEVFGSYINGREYERYIIVWNKFIKEFF